MICSYDNFQRQYVCIVKMLRKKPGPSAADELWLSSELFELVSAHPNTWTKRAEDWLASQ